MGKRILNNNNLGSEVNKALNSTSTASNIWIKFFPKFSSTFNNRKNLTSDEVLLIKKMGNVFDKGFKFTANLETLLNNAKYVDKDFEKNQPQYILNLKSMEMYFGQISEISTSFLNLVKFFCFFS